MTEQEKQLITDLAERIRNAPPPQIDRDAYDLILHTIGSRPDVLYILTQTVLLQEMALTQAKRQIEELKSHVNTAQQGGFLPRSQPGGWGQESKVQQPSPYQPSSYQNSSYATQAPPPPPSGGGFSNFLHSAATTAAGVIAGELAFDTLSSIFGHRGGGLFGGGGGFFGGGSGISPGSETIVNNYYGDERGGDDSRFAEAAYQDQNISSDIEDERDNSGDSFADDSSFDSGDDGGSSDI
jgi:uncharacterized protein